MAERIATAPMLGIRLVCVTDYGDGCTPRAYIESLTPAGLTPSGQSCNIDLIDGDMLEDGGQTSAVENALREIAAAAYSIRHDALNMQTGGKYDWRNHPACRMEAEADALLEAYEEAMKEVERNVDIFNATHRWYQDTSIGGDGLYHSIPA